MVGCRCDRAVKTDCDRDQVDNTREVYRMKRLKPERVYHCCGLVLAVTENLNGVKIKCPSCGKEQRVSQTTPKIVIFTK